VCRETVNLLLSANFKLRLGMNQSFETFENWNCSSLNQACTFSFQMATLLDCPLSERCSKTTVSVGLFHNIVSPAKVV
jgi:hypothetical protein